MLLDFFILLFLFSTIGAGLIKVSQSKFSFKDKSFLNLFVLASVSIFILVREKQTSETGTMPIIVEVKKPSAKRELFFSNESIIHQQSLKFSIPVYEEAVEIM